MSAIFQLSAIVPRGVKNSNGSIDTFERDLGVYDSVAASEAILANILAKGKGRESFFAFYLKERSVNAGLVGPFGKISEWESIRSYFADGRLNCLSECDEACVKEFTGRDARSIRYSVGDIVWVRQYNRLMPMMIGGLPMTKTEYRSHKAKWKNDQIPYRGGDWSDDCYYTYGYGHDHDHPACWDVFPYIGTISRHNRERLEKCRDWYRSRSWE